MFKCVVGIFIKLGIMKYQKGSNQYVKVSKVSEEGTWMDVFMGLSAVAFLLFAIIKGGVL